MPVRTVDARVLYDKTDSESESRRIADSSSSESDALHRLDASSGRFASRSLPLLWPLYRASMRRFVRSGPGSRHRCGPGSPSSDEESGKSSSRVAILEL